LTAEEPRFARVLWSEELRAKSREEERERLCSAMSCELFSNELPVFQFSGFEESQV
jgi:hypothetical protein